MRIEEIEPMPVKCRQSAMICAERCERKWWCKYRMGITLRGGEYKGAATLGKIYHRLQQLGPGGEDEVKKEVRQQQIDLMAQVDKGEDLDGQIVRTANNLTMLYDKAVVMAHIFWERFPQPEFFKTLATEVKVEMEYEGLTLSGTIDKLLLDVRDDAVWIRDHKSTSQSLDCIFSALPWGIQGRMYRILATEWIRQQERGPNTEPCGLKVKGFILDGVLVPGIKLCKTDLKNSRDWGCTKEEAYLRRVKEWYAEKPDATMRSKGVIYTEKMFQAELITSLCRMKELQAFDPHHVERFERDITRSECFMYQKQCIYHDLCSTDPKQWGPLFETKYKVEDPEQGGNANAKAAVQDTDEG